VTAESVNDAFEAMERLREKDYCAVVLDPVIRHRLNGYAVLSFIELEQPETLEHLFLLTGMSEQTIRRTAPSALPRLLRKPSAAKKVVATVMSACGLTADQDDQQHKRSVLLVEDDLLTANATRSVLIELGYSVEWARNGIEALHHVAEREFDVIMLDLVMPQMDGFTVLEHFRSEKPGLLRRVIVTTGIPDKYVQALNHGAICGIIHKPLQIEPLDKLLRDCPLGNPAVFEAGGESPSIA
jgi:CheY-like chemotaxis protein